MQRCIIATGLGNETLHNELGQADPARSIFFPLMAAACKLLGETCHATQLAAIVFAGVKLTDDVVDISLTAVFSDLLDPTQSVCKPFTLPLCTDNVPNHGGFTTTFPYLGPAK